MPKKIYMDGVHVMTIEDTPFQQKIIDLVTHEIDARGGTSRVDLNDNYQRQQDLVKRFSQAQKQFRAYLKLAAPEMHIDAQHHYLRKANEQYDIYKYVFKEYQAIPTNDRGEAV